MEKELQNILEKIIPLYSKYGIKSITMDDVAKELGISKKTLYQYVTDKNDLVHKAVMFDVERHFFSINCIKEKKLNAIEEIFEINRYLSSILRNYNPSWDYDLKKYYAETYSTLFQKRREQMLSSVMDNINRGIKEGFYRTDVNAKLIAKLHVLRIETMINTDIFTPEEFTSVEVFHELFYYHIRGIANAKGIKYIEEKIKKVIRKRELKIRDMKNKILILVLLTVSIFTIHATDTTKVKLFTLKEAQEFAVSNNYSTQNARTDIIKANYQVKQTTAIGLPQINASASYQDMIDIPTQLIPDFLSPVVEGVLLQKNLITKDQLTPMSDQKLALQFGTKHNLTGSITASQLLFDGSYIVGLQAAKTYVEISKRALKKSETEVKESVAQAYYLVPGSRRK